MGTVDERVAAVEARVGEHAVMVDGLREAVASLDRRIGSLESRMDQRFTALETRIDQRFATIDDRFTRLDDKMFRQFVWTIGAQVTMFLMLTATLLSAILIQR